MTNAYSRCCGDAHGSDRRMTTPTETAAFALASTLLFVPGDRPGRFAKAVASGADGVILDLKDAVAPPDKDDAPSHVAHWLTSSTVVRINAVDTPWFRGPHGTA